jgi:hypothetical protein
MSANVDDKTESPKTTLTELVDFGRSPVVIVREATTDELKHRLYLEAEKEKARLEEERLENAARRAKNEREEIYQRRVKTALYLVALIFTSAIMSCSLWLLLSKDTPSDLRTWVTATVTSILSGVLGYLFGKSSEK